MTFVIHNARAVDGNGTVKDTWIAFSGDTITARGTGKNWHSHADDGDFNANGLWLTPGFIDLHSHGGGRHAYDDGPEAIQQALAVHRAHGTTRSIITLVANPPPKMQENLRIVADLTENDPLVLGSHLEGPFLAMERRGAHNGDYMCLPDTDMVDNFIEAARKTLRYMTLAPELPHAIETIEHLTAQNIVVGVGHTNADYTIAQKAFNHGATLLTHTFNGMNGIHHREPGPIIAAFHDERVSLEIILDGLHVHPHAAQIVFTSAPGRVALITDAMAAAGSIDGHYKLGSLNVTVTHGMAVLSGTTTIAGSTLTQDRALKNAIETLKQSPKNAVAMLTSIPAGVLGLDNYLGYLTPGYAADFVLLDTEWNVQKVWGAGAVII